MVLETDNKKLLDTDASTDALLASKTDKYRGMLGLPTEQAEAKMAGSGSVHEEDGSWYFWDETGVGRYGPYDTEEACRVALEKYAKQLGE